MSRSRIPHTLLMSNVPLSRSRSRSRKWLRFIHDLRLLGRTSDKRMGGYAAKIRGVR